MIKKIIAYFKRPKCVNEYRCADCIHSDAHWEDIDKEEIRKAVELLDLFTKTFCRYKNDYERFDDLKFRCDECPFRAENDKCLAKSFKNKYAPDYRDFGSMGDL